MAIRSAGSVEIENIETGEIEISEVFEADTPEDLAELLGIEFLPIADSLIDYGDEF